jgi:hypothetical protein
MLGVQVTGITLVYAEKVKFISFTFPALNHGEPSPETAPDLVYAGGV